MRGKKEERKNEEREKSVLIASNRHHRWGTKATWTNFHYNVLRQEDLKNYLLGIFLIIFSKNILVYEW